jgi:hypothetical protein
MKKNSSIFKSFNSFEVFKSNLDPSTILDDIDMLQKEETRYIYQSGDSAKFISSEKIYNPYSFNYFSLYNKSIYNAFLEVKKLFIEAATKKEINIKRAYYYISSEYNDKMDPNFWYDMGSIKVPCFSGYYFLDAKENTKIVISEQEVNVSKGDILLFESGRKIKINREGCKFISFNIAPLQFIANQYPQKWMPIG